MPSRSTSIEVQPGAEADAPPGALTGRSAVTVPPGSRSGDHVHGPRAAATSGHTAAASGHAAATSGHAAAASGHAVATGGHERVAIGHGALDSDQAGDLAGTFKALGDPVRLRLLSMIASADGGEICVCDLSEAFPLTGPTISHHLRILREAGLVHGARRGTWVYYRAVPGELTRLAGVLDAGRPIP